MITSATTTTRPSTALTAPLKRPKAPETIYTSSTTSAMAMAATIRAETSFLLFMAKPPEWFYKVSIGGPSRARTSVK